MHPFRKTRFYTSETFIILAGDSHPSYAIELIWGKVFEHGVQQT